MDFSCQRHDILITPHERNEVERSVVMAMRTRYGHLGEMRQSVLDDRDCMMSHISDMLDQPRPSLTTLRSACMVLIAPVSTSHASGMTFCRTFACVEQTKSTTTFSLSNMSQTT